MRYTIKTDLKQINAVYEHTVRSILKTEVIFLHTSDKQALINLAVLTVRYMKNSGKTDEEVRYILSKRLNFSDIMIDQIM